MPVALLSGEEFCLKNTPFLSDVDMMKTLLESLGCYVKYDREQKSINIKNNFENYTILRPSIVYSREDSFTTNFMSLLSKLPIMPLYYNGETKFVPIHVSDLAEIIYQIISNDINNK